MSNASFVQRDLIPRSPDATPRPFLKWAGGKGQLLPQLLERIELAGNCARYHEPFFGGGALYFELSRTGGLKARHARLSDANTRLVETYAAVRDDVETVIALLLEHADQHNEEHFYAVRAALPDTPAARAARIIYLNRTCFNGLYRENSSGGFNVPMGRYKNPTICDETNLRAVAHALAKARISSKGFAASAKDVAAGDFVYFDPPYHPTSATANFTSYHQDNFGAEQQAQLATVFRELDQRGAKLLLSNSDTPLIHELYKGLTIEQVFATRNVNSNAAKRGKVAELLVRNY
jgi:DNA adenine methylase